VYLGSEMRKSTVLLRGAKPERRLSLLSLFSNVSSGTSPSSPAQSTSGRIANVLRRWSGRSNPTSPVSAVPLARRPSFDKMVKEEELEMTEAVSRDGVARSFPSKKAGGPPRFESEKDAIHEEPDEEDLASMEAVIFGGRLGEAVV
jgi:hypothetical protein